MSEVSTRRKPSPLQPVSEDADSSPFARAARAAVNFLVSSPKLVQSVLASSLQSLSSPAADGSNSPQSSPLRGTAGAALRRVVNARKFGAKIKDRLFNRQKLAEEKHLKRLNSAASMLDYSKSPAGTSSIDAGQPKTLLVCKPKLEIVPPEFPKEACWNAGLMRLTYDVARKYHQSRTTFQARRTDHGVRHPAAMMWETFSDIRIAVRVIIVLKRFLRLTHPRLSERPKEAEATSSHQTVKMPAEAAWQELLHDVEKDKAEEYQSEHTTADAPKSKLSVARGTSTRHRRSTSKSSTEKRGSLRSKTIDFPLAVVP